MGSRYYGERKSNCSIPNTTYETVSRIKLKISKRTHKVICITVVLVKLNQ